MSLFLSAELPCPSCATPVNFDLVHSVNADRRPDLRVAILDRSFQQQPCPSCGYAFRVEPELNFIDVRRGQWIAVWPSSKREQWDSLEQVSKRAFDAAFGAQAPAAARELGAGMTASVVFGWPALAEKLIAKDAGIDDLTLEIAKAALLRNADEIPVGDGGEWRLLGVDGDELVFGRIRAANEELLEVMRGPKALIAELEADAASWGQLRGDLSKGPYRDLGRLLN